jgi:ABC-2 type transport system ATP-binding protein
MHVIEANKLTKYYGETQGIADLDLKVESGEIYGFIGPNGAGKSTTIRTLLGLIFPSSGSGRIFELDMNRKILDLSRGNQKKVSILQSLIHRPNLLILDEPTNGLDPLMQEKFFELLKEENSRGTTIFFSSHTLSEVQKMCRRVGIIKAGRLIAQEDVETLRKKQLRKVQIEFSHTLVLFALSFVIYKRKDISI